MSPVERAVGVTCDPSTGVCLPPTVVLGFLEEEMETIAPHVLSEPSDAARCPIPVSLRNAGSEAPGYTPAGPSVPRGPRGISLAWTQRRGPLAGWPPARPSVSGRPSPGPCGCSRAGWCQAVEALLTAPSLVSGGQPCRELALGETPLCGLGRGACRPAGWTSHQPDSAP